MNEQTNQKPEKEIVYPGQVLGENMSCDENCVKDENQISSLVRGISRKSTNRIGVIPINGAYTPKSGDFVVGVVTDDLGAVYFVGLNGPYFGILRNDDRRRGPDIEVGDIVNAKIVYVDEVKEPQLARPWKLEGGYIIEVNPKKVPRIIGRQKSMLTLLRDKTGCNINVGQNGLVWIKGDATLKAAKAIKYIEKNAHTSGLTDRMNKVLDDLMAE